MKVLVTNFAEKSAVLHLDGKVYPVDVRPNKYDDKTVLIPISKFQVKLEELEKGVDHKNWLTVSKTVIEQEGEIEVETAKKTRVDIDINKALSWSKYLSAEDAGVYLTLLNKIQVALVEQNALPQVKEQADS